MENKIIEKLQEFCRNEYDTQLRNEDLKDLTRIGIMYTMYENGEVEDLDEELTVEVFVNIIDFKIWVEYNSIKVYEEVYNKKDFIEQLDYLDFQSWTNLDELDTYKNKRT